MKQVNVIVFVLAGVFFTRCGVEKRNKLFYPKLVYGSLQSIRNALGHERYRPDNPLHDGLNYYVFSDTIMSSGMIVKVLAGFDGSYLINAHFTFRGDILDSSLITFYDSCFKTSHVSTDSSFIYEYKDDYRTDKAYFTTYPKNIDNKVVGSYSIELKE